MQYFLGYLFLWLLEMSFMRFKAPFRTFLSLGCGSPAAWTYWFWEEWLNEDMWVFVMLLWEDVFVLFLFLYFLISLGDLSHFWGLLSNFE